MPSRILSLLMCSILLPPAFQSFARHRFQAESQRNDGAVVSTHPTPGLTIEFLVETSDLIVLGELVTVERAIIGGGTVEFNGKSIKVGVDRATLRIDEILHGAQASPLVFDLVRPLQDIGWEVPGPQAHGLFFFRFGENKKVTFTNPYYPLIYTPRDFHSRGDTPLDRVVSILGDMLVRPSPSSPW